MNLKRLAYAGSMVALLASSGLLAGCSDATWAKYNAWGVDHQVKVYSNGTLIGDFCSTGKIENDVASDGYYFQDRNTGNVVTVSGDVQITIGCDQDAEKK